MSMNAVEMWLMYSMVVMWAHVGILGIVSPMLLKDGISPTSPVCVSSCNQQSILKGGGIICNPHKGRLVHEFIPGE